MHFAEQPRLILFPGLDGTGSLFDPLVKSLGSAFNCQVVSYPPGLPPDWSAYADHAATTAGPLDGAWIVAESFSGPVVINLLEHHTPAIAGLILVATFAASPRPTLLALTRLLPMRALFRIPVPEFVVRNLLLENTTPTQVLDLFRSALKKVSPTDMAARVQMLSRIHPPTRDMPSISAFYLQAANDRLVPARCVLDFKCIFPNVRIETTPGPHLILQARPSESAALILKFIG